MHATGMKNVKYCTITLQLRSRQNLFKKIWEAYAGKGRDRATIEIVLNDKNVTPVVIGLAKGDKRLDEMCSIGTDLEQFVTESKSSGTPAPFQDSSTVISDWKKHLKSPLKVLTDCPEALKTTSGIFTSQVLGVINHLVAEDVFEFLHISSQLVEIHESRWRDTQAYQNEKTRRSNNATSIKDLNEGCLGVRFSFSLPLEEHVGEKYSSENAVLLPIHLAVYLAQKLSSFTLGQQVHQRQCRRHAEPLETSLKGILDKRASENKKKEQRQEMAEQKKRQKDCIASVTKAGPPKARALYG
eukprot:TRINITY_DN7541_c0_g1_i2.p1 TRINITY_DN7541_c0_g1~~TRINITY_DN7541_c0_g1_i2.p1  ORF type:complete len:299 (+),score=45.24 TRINITY_DN7541_c0_g1_i2:1566-2462(+)